MYMDGASSHSHDEECETPCTYTECILSVFLSGIPSVYVTGGYTAQRWTTPWMIRFFLLLDIRDFFPPLYGRTFEEPLAHLP
ncbi:hypothetical protein TSAR_000762 [Trichomalopsis sarcophagae]|uniref:Uncharacterized protein n=1 Tax=Trichomalopsis sarcophagae TaxID=543379 RepID=A0A232FH00_9HYME|nr:hypothetical protein TSAR_000762 [Trichomalopsis sarcophagae]